MPQMTPRPALRPTAQAPADAVVARPGSYLGAMPSNAAESNGLLQGLASLNPVLEGMLHEQRASANAQAAAADAQSRKDAATQGAAEAARLGTSEVPDALSGKPIDVPYTIPGGHSREWGAAFQTGLAQRQAVSIKADAMADWHNQKGNPDFDAKAWMAQVRQHALSGVQDATAVGAIGAHLTQLEAEVSGEYEKSRVVRLDAANSSNMAAMARTLFTPAGSTQDHEDAIGTMDKALGETQPAGEVRKAAFLALQAQSTARGGVPELFDVFRRPGVLDSSPELGPQVEAARKAALEERQKAETRAALPVNAAIGANLTERLKKDPASITLPELMGQVGPQAYFHTGNDMAAFYGRVLDAQDKGRAAAQLGSFASAGTLWRASDSDQHKFMDDNLGGLLDAFVGATGKAADQASIQAAAQVGIRILQTQSSYGTKTEWPPMKGAMQSLVSNLQNGTQASPQFLVAAEMYKALAANPGFRDTYFPEKVGDIMRSFTSTQPGSDPHAAYVAAYEANTPEAKARASAAMATPEGHKLLQDKLGGLTGGTGWWPRILGGDGKAAENPGLTSDTRTALTEYLKAHPGATMDEAKQYRDEWVGKNYVLDRTTRQAVKVPPQFGGQDASDALSAYTEKLSQVLDLGSRNDADWKVHLIPMGDNVGTFQVVTMAGSATQSIGQVSMQMLQQWHRTSKELTDQERASLGAIREASKTGKLLDNVDPAFLSKARTLGYLDRDAVEAYRKRQLDGALQSLNAAPQAGLAGYTDAPATPAPRKGAILDHRLTASTALSFLRQPSGGTAVAHQPLALALITAGEGVALRAYEDPAWGAGRNIGMGYNLKANAANARKDLGQAGVTGEAATAVIEGRAALSPDQSKRLLQVALSTYEAQAKKAAEDTAPGLWDRMSHAQRAVMIDVGYQTGDPAQFRTAFRALASGDAAGFAGAIKVTYKNRAGTRVEDTSRGALRAAMLAGQGAFEARLGTLSRIPSNQLQAAAPPN